MEIFTRPWPWYIGGPLIGLMVPALLILTNKSLGISSSFRHICAACIPGKLDFFRYNWRDHVWSFYFVGGIILGAFIGGVLLANPNPVAISAQTVSELQALGIHDFSGLVPSEIFNLGSLLSLKGFIMICVGGFLVGFGTRYAGGCTSGHTIMGISNLQVPSMVASAAFFIGGIIMTHFLLPYILAL